MQCYLQKGIMISFTFSGLRDVMIQCFQTGKYRKQTTHFEAEDLT